METGVVVTSAGERFQKIASPWHTMLVLGVQIALSVRGYLRSEQLRALTNPDRISIYEHTIIFQWLVFAVVIVGVRLHGTSLTSVLGERWRSLQQFFTDLGISMLLLMASIMVPAILEPHSQTQSDPATKFLLPQNSAEIAWWVALSLTAGLCEEVLFRGYLQKQFLSLTKNAAGGILISAVLFGAAHGYQGLRRAVTISIMGAILGTAAYWRRSTRPGIVAHASQDLLGGLLRH